MHKSIRYHILTVGVRVALSLLAASSVANAQQGAHNTPTQLDLYCSGIVTDQPVDNKLYIISGEDSGYKSTFSHGDSIYINSGSEQGVNGVAVREGGFVAGI